MTPPTESAPLGERAASRTFLAAFAAAILACQLLLGLWGADDALTRGHNSFNSAAYLQAARNSLRWDVLLPHQYYTAAHPPPASDAYTHAPLAAHLHNVAAVWLFGDRPLAVRGVAALHAWLVTCALLIVVRSHWSLAHGVLAAAFYTVAPINAIYLNMVNHSAGFQLWSIAMLHCYLRLRQHQLWRWFVCLLLSAWLACSWDWPAYYVAFCLALHWLGSWLLARRRAQPGLSSPRLLLCWALFCAWILLNVGVFLAILHGVAAGSSDLLQTFSARQSSTDMDFWRNARIVPRLLFTLPVLAVCAGWLIELPLRLWRGGAQARDLLPCAFAAAGGVHYFLFRDSATVHEYWLWPALPFVAFALADFMVRGWARGSAIARGRYAPTLRACVLALLAVAPVSLLARSAELVPRGRQVGGSLWFVADVRRPVPEAYDSGRAELRFASQVRAWTDRETGVLIEEALDRLFQLEPRFDVTLDRELRRVATGPIAPAPAQGIRGWVYIGTMANHSTHAVLALAGEHPLTFYDHYFMIDLRRRDPSVRVYRLARAESSFGYRLLQSSFEPSMRAVRDPEAEQELALRRPRAGRWR